MKYQSILEEGITEYSRQRDFTGLVCWKDCKDLKLFLYSKVLPLLPKEELYNLNVQIRKAAISITANIAEGYGRYHYQEGIQFYRISRGSIYEVKDHLISCFELGFIDKENFELGNEMIEKAKISLNGFIKYVKKRKENAL